MNVIRAWVIIFIVASLLSGCTKIDDPSLQPSYDNTQPVTLPAKEKITADPLKNVFFGDLHIHTGLSTDAFILGVRSEPEDVYVFAKGGVIEHGAGYPLQTSRPLDFAAVTDHSEYLGQARVSGLDIPTTQRSLRDLLLEGNVFSITKAWLLSTNFIRTHGFGFGEDKVDKAVNLAAWQQTIAAAERHNDPGVFTAFIGYEWSAFAGSPTIHMHRNVIYRSNDVSAIPFSSLDSQRPEDLWSFLEAENKAGRAVLAIPHNANLSDGNMYANRDSEGKPLTAEYAAMRSRYEPISEIMQVKGSSETHPLLSSEDEFANFELTSLEIGGGEPDFEAVKGSYMRDALRVGMELSHEEGFNPFKFGVIGASDSHNASSPAEESDFQGKLPLLDGTAALRTNAAMLLPKRLNPVPRWGSGGLAGVWAEENTRASLFDALLRKETYATSGPRMSVRFFGGWQYTDEILTQPDNIQQAYDLGVAMGGELGAVSGDKHPRFVVWAMKDPEGANLDRVQIIKAWVDSQGKSHEKVINIAVSVGRSIDAVGNVEPVGNTVDITTATYTNSIGSEILSAVWEDTDFQAEQEAFYYARVLEIPTPRWSTYDAVTFGTEPMEPTSIQERAITSAIWYSPKANTAQ